MAKRKPAVKQGTPTPPVCIAQPLTLAGDPWNGWGRDNSNSRLQRAPGLTADGLSALQLRWAYAYPAIDGGTTGDGQPTLLHDRVLLTGADGEVRSLDLHTGCTYWTYRAGRSVATAITVAPAPLGVPANYIAYFGDDQAYAHAIDAETGKPLWRTRLDLDPNARIGGAPKLYQGRLYVPITVRQAYDGRTSSTFVGALAALDASTGALLWKSFTLTKSARSQGTQADDSQRPAGAGIVATPTIDAQRDLIYVATGKSTVDGPIDGANAVIAFDAKTGRRKWSVSPTPADASPPAKGDPACSTRSESACIDEFSAPPILKTLSNGIALLLVGQKSGVVYALDADHDGKIVWQSRVGAGGAYGGIAWGMAADDRQLYVAVSDLLNVRSAMPGIAALRLDTGEKVWYAATPPAKCSFTGGRCARAQSAAVTAIPGAVISGAFDGKLRAYSTHDGTLLWQFDTGGTFATVNNGSVSGGNIDGGGAVIADSYLLVNTGIATWGGLARKALLVLTFGAP